MLVIQNPGELLVPHYCRLFLGRPSWMLHAFFLSLLDTWSSCALVSLGLLLLEEIRPVSTGHVEAVLF